MQQFLRIIQPLLEFWSQRLRGDLGRNHYVSGCGIGRHELHFVNLDGGIFDFAERVFNVLGDILALGAPNRESADQAGKIRHRYFGGKMNARQTRSGKQLRKCALRLASFDRNAVEQQFATGNPQQKTAVPRLWNRRLQFVPGDFELALGALMLEAIHAHVLHQDVETVHERTGRCVPVVLIDVCGIDTPLLAQRSLVRVMRTAMTMHVTEVIVPMWETLRSPRSAERVEGQAFVLRRSMETAGPLTCVNRCSKTRNHSVTSSNAPSRVKPLLS